MTDHVKLFSVLNAGPDNMNLPVHFQLIMSDTKKPHLPWPAFTTKPTVPRATKAWTAVAVFVPGHAATIAPTAPWHAVTTPGATESRTVATPGTVAGITVRIATYIVGLIVSRGISRSKIVG